MLPPRNVKQDKRELAFGKRRGADWADRRGAEHKQSPLVWRQFLYAAAIGGEAAVSHAVNILSSEISRNMGLLRINSPGEIGPDRLLRLGGAEGART
ncbi:MAG TPA: alpha-hydroxy-acid oxidizing protein [Microvirga sp.]|nr:alpha-hydroxy-acid oxidizing protein [Microvirga sp.]